MLTPRCTFGGSAPNRFVLPNDFMNDKGQELLGKVGVEFADRREMPQTADLLASLPGSREGSPCCAFDFPTARVHRNRSANMWTIASSILSMLSRSVAKFGNGIGRIHHYTFSFFVQLLRRSFGCRRQDAVSRDVLLSV